MKGLILTNWRTSLLAVIILTGLLMFGQGKITTVDFLALVALLNAGGYLLAKDAAADQAAPRPAPGTAARVVEEIGFWLIVVLLSGLVGLSFLPLVRDALSPNREFIRPAEPLEAMPPTLPADND